VENGKWYSPGLPARAVKARFCAVSENNDQRQRNSDHKIENDLQGKHQPTLLFQSFHFISLSGSNVRAHTLFRGHKIVMIGGAFVYSNRNDESSTVCDPLRRGNNFPR
jgi:hypothetical protein